MPQPEHGPSAPQPSIDRMRRFGIQPRRKWGQNFLIDNNILEVISQSAEITGGDVVLEVGGGLGVLSEHLAARVAHLHVIEIDRTLEAALNDALGSFENVDLLFADAVQTDYATLTPRPAKLVANLPYNVAATCVIKAFEELPELQLCCVMAQREVGQRLAAAPGSKLYGATSVLVQSVAEVSAARKLSRNIFHPVPNVDSSLLTLRRLRINPPVGFSELVHDCFAHRRKPLAGSVAHARREDRTVKQRLQAALESLGLDPGLRAEALSAEQFLALFETLEAAA